MFLFYPQLQKCIKCWDSVQSVPPENPNQTKKFQLKLKYQMLRCVITVYLLICCSICLSVIRSSVKETLALSKVIIDWCQARLITLHCKLACFIVIWMYSTHDFIHCRHPCTRRVRATWKWTLRAFCWPNVLKTEYTALDVQFAKMGTR